MNNNNKCKLLIYHVSKKSNVGMLIRSAVAFGCDEIILIGKKKEYNTFGSKGTTNYIRMIYKDKLEDGVKYLKDDNFTIIGLEILEEALPITEFNNIFTQNTAFILGNEGDGLTPKAKAICDRFIYIPQVGHGTASLNVAVAGSIILHYYCVWANYIETPREGQKFIVDENEKIWRKERKRLKLSETEKKE